MNIQFKGVRLDLTPALKVHAEKKISTLDKLISHLDPGNIAECDIEFSRTTAHHHKGDVFEVEIHLKIPRKVFRASESAPDMYAAFDKAKEKLKYSIERYKELAEDREKQQKK